MSAASVEQPVARSYTKARRHPWVIGKLGEITLWLGPYSRPQLVVAGVGTVVLLKTYAWWAPVFGPVPIAALGCAVWAARRTRIGGRVPEAALWGWLLVLAQPRAGRIGGRVARDRTGAELVGGFYVTDTRSAPAQVAGPAAQRAAQFAPADAQLSAQAPARCAQPMRAGASPVRRPAGQPAVGPLAPAASGPRSALQVLLEQAENRTSREG